MGLVPTLEAIDELSKLGFVEWCGEADRGSAPATSIQANGAVQAHVARNGRIRATPSGRFVLNRIVYQLSSTLKPLPG